MRSSTQNESDDCNAERNGDMKESFASLVCMPRIEVCGDDRKNVWRCGEQQRFHVRVAECLDDGRKEVGDRRGRYISQEHDSKDPSLHVSHCKFETVEKGLRFGRCPVILSDILNQAVCSQLSFFFAKPHRGSRHVRYDEERNQGDKDCYDTLDDEYPSPSSESFGAVHVTRNPGGDQATESS